jgi:ribosomal protein S18 acetylase RimI-like enzyme
MAFPRLLDSQEPVFTDLDQRPDMVEAVVELFARFGPGRYHAVSGEPSRMGQVPRRQDLQDSLGCLLALEGNRVAGALVICPYSDQQVTLWGPVIDSGHQGRSFGPRLLAKAKEALAEGGFDSVRVLNDHRNRRARRFFLSHGFSPWKDNHVYERELGGPMPATVPGVTLARAADQDEVASVILSGFPETGHCDVPLTERERQGYRHWILQDAGHIIGVAVMAGGRRSWLSLYAIHPQHQGRGLGTRLLDGVLLGEQREGSKRLGLEVLADNKRAIGIYEQAGFERRWTCSILVGPV